MRSPGELQGVWAAESHVDLIARELGLDPLEFRLNNVVAPGRHRRDRGRRSTARKAPPSSSVCRRRAGQPTSGVPAAGGASAWAPATSATAVRRCGSASARMRGSKSKRVCRIRARARTPWRGAWWPRRSALMFGRVDVTYASTLGGVFDAGAGGSKSTHSIGAVAVQTGTELKHRLEELAAEVMGWPGWPDPASGRPLRLGRRERRIRGSRRAHWARADRRGGGHACARSGAWRRRRQCQLHRLRD